MIRGLVEDYQFPIFFGFDIAVRKELFDQTVIMIENVGGKCLASTSDQGGDNIGLKNELGITEDNVTYPNPAHPSRPIYFLFDFVHIYKNLRNNMLDHTMILPDKTRIKALVHFRQLFNHCRGNEISEASYLKTIMLDCKKSDRQTVKFATNLLCNKTASLFRKYFPNDPVKLKLADFIDTVADSSLHSFHNHFKCDSRVIGHLGVFV